MCKSVRLSVAVSQGAVRLWPLWLLPNGGFEIHLQRKLDCKEGGFKIFHHFVVAPRTHFQPAVLYRGYADTRYRACPSHICWLSLVFITRMQL